MGKQMRIKRKEEERKTKKGKNSDMSGEVQGRKELE